MSAKKFRAFEIAQIVKINLYHAIDQKEWPYVFNISQGINNKANKLDHAGMAEMFGRLYRHHLAILKPEVQHQVWDKVFPTDDAIKDAETAEQTPNAKTA